MTRDNIIRMAREIGIEIYANDTHLVAHTHELERFAALVAAAEREACAAVLERGVDLSGLNSEPTLQKFAVDLLMNCADAIRARGEK